MARREDKSKAIELRKKGCSYSQIKEELDISKSTLSGWLRDLPLSKQRLDELQRNDRVIEKIRETKRRKKKERRAIAYSRVVRDIETSKNNKFVAGFYLYWGEGTKTAEYTVSLTNSDPSIVRCFVEWLDLLNVERKSLRIKLHLYKDQNEKELIKFWSQVIGVSKDNFNKSYVKETSSKNKNYKGLFPYGTCVVAYHDRDMRDYVMSGIDYLRKKYS